ncbi:glycoside hydrolase family 2 protein [Diplocloster agilis]|uniref:glycoside hydrolase family 2 protein n=1 Tax=Diplocloster agilis TaxID=2850323 RepID=UPI001EE94BAC|nr:sugar-binding domain-containing protein [Diplocloster agilis]
MKETTISLKQLYTKWGKKLDRECPLPEHPRPQLMRKHWENLNGVWEYAILEGVPGRIPARFDGEIVVPFSPESALSGVGRRLEPGQTLWYSRKVRFDAGEGERVLLHFGAVDQCCTVYCNGNTAGRHEGGYWPFSLDITEFVKEGENLIQLAVTDESDGGLQAYGKQRMERGGIWYTPQSGIWQTVWVEYVPEVYIRDLKITPHYDEGCVDFTLFFQGQLPPSEVLLEIFDGDTAVVREKFQGNRIRAVVPEFKSWSPESPFLYRVILTVGEDCVESYFGMRKFGMMMDAHGYPRLALNGRPVFHNGLLDQGYFSDGLYTAPSDEAIVEELSRVKALGFNMLRKHIKIEPMRWYYHCDRLGIFVWQDFVSGGGPFNIWMTQNLPFLGVEVKDDRYKLLGRRDPLGRRIFEKNMRDTVKALYNVVSLAVWVPFNEGWGQFDAVRIAQTLHKLDPTRLIDHASGWYDQGAGDIRSYHVYNRRFRMKKDPCGRIQALTEFGGYSCPSRKHMVSRRLFGYRILKSREELTEVYEKLYREEVLGNVEHGLSAAVYTQVSDVEDEINGLFTYDRAVLKINKETVRRINREIQEMFEKASAAADTL